MEVFEFNSDAEMGRGKPETRRPHTAHSAARGPSKSRLGGRSSSKQIHRRPKSSSGTVRRTWAPNNSDKKWHASRGDPHTRRVSTTKSPYAVVKKRSESPPLVTELRSQQIGDQAAGLLGEAELVNSFWPGSRLGANSMLPTVSAENVKLERRMSRFLSELQNDIGKDSTVQVLRFVNRCHAECVHIMNRDLERICEQTISVEVAQQGMYCIGHVNLLCQAWNELFKYTQSHAATLRSARNVLVGEMEEMQRSADARIKLLEDKVADLKPIEIPEDKEEKNESNGKVGRYTLAARQRNREINYSAASRQLQDLYTKMMDGKNDPGKKKGKRSRLKARTKITGEGTGNAPNMDVIMKNRNPAERASMLEQVYRSFNTAEKVDVVASMMSEMNEGERKHLNADYITDLPEDEKVEILRAMTKGVDVDERSMMIENLLEGLTGDERSAMIVEELDTLPDKQLLKLVTTLLSESLKENDRKDIINGVLEELSQREKEETVVELVAMVGDAKLRKKLFLACISGFPENERSQITNQFGKRETKEIGVNTEALSKKSPKGKKKKKGSGTAKQIQELPSSVRNMNWAKYLVVRPSHVKHRAISVNRAEKLIGHIYKKKILGDKIDDREGANRVSMCENVYHYFSQKYGMKKMAEEFIYGMVDIAHKSRDRHKRVHTFGVLIGKIETESYSPVITDAVMAWLQHVYPPEKIGSAMDDGDGKTWALLSACQSAFRKVFVPVGGEIREDEKKDLGKNKFYLPAQSFTNADKQFREWAKPAKDIDVKATKKMGSKEAC